MANPPSRPSLSLPIQTLLLWGLRALSLGLQPTPLLAPLLGPAPLQHQAVKGSLRHLLPNTPLLAQGRADQKPRLLRLL